MKPPGVVLRCLSELLGKRSQADAPNGGATNDEYVVGVGWESHF